MVWAAGDVLSLNRRLKQSGFLKTQRSATRSCGANSCAVAHWSAKRFRRQSEDMVATVKDPRRSHPHFGCEATRVLTSSAGSRQLGQLGVGLNSTIAVTSFVGSPPERALGFFWKKLIVHQSVVHARPSVKARNSIL
jgi:hypothetical protein